ncbi:MAG: multicopper oxidase domain-containing protein, partial [Candidatus Nanopelagicales bacterium]|nr:multicopper oxidase domain-containing protein [Candidatus Nanopelagicales bacterium]
GGVGLGVAVVVLAVTAAIAADPMSIGRATGVGSSSSTVATGETTTVRVEAAHMRFLPDVIDVPTGNRLVIELVNVDDMVHDLVFANGANSGRLMPGESTKLDVGIIGGRLEGWCSIVGHRQMGMVLTVNPTGDANAEAGRHSSHSSADHASDQPVDPPADIDFGASPGPGFQARDARLSPAPDRRVHRMTLTVQEVEREIAPGVTQRLWTFNGSAPGPVLRGRVGDVFDITFVNDGTMGHSIDFHAGSLAPDRPMRTINPGESLRYRFTARLSGIWMYHCGTMPMSAHIANGLFGAVIIDPPDLPPVAAEYLLVQSELYLGPNGGVVDLDKIEAQRPDAVVFNGYVNQYDYRPLVAPVGRRIRIWVLDAGPDRPSAFHVIGGQFDAVFQEGRLALSPARDRPGGSQVLGLLAAQGGYVELVLPEAGTYPFVSHVMWDAEHGAHGLLQAR